MRNDHYPSGTVQALLPTDLVTPATRYALQERLQKEPVSRPLFFDADSFITLRAVCMRLIPQPNSDRMVDLPGNLDDLLAKGKGNGWRYDTMPADGDAFTMGLEGINETAGLMYGRPFHQLTTTGQDNILGLIQSGVASGAAWKVLPATLFFEELLSALVEIYYSHPYAKDDIGDATMADAKGWQKIGLNELEVQEPTPLKEEVYAGS